MKKRLVMTLICCMSVASLVACGDKKKNEEESKVEQEQILEDEIVEPEDADVPEVEEEQMSNESSDLLKELESTNFETIADFAENYKDFESEGYAIGGGEGTITFSNDEVKVIFEFKESEQLDVDYPDGTFDVDTEELYEYYNVVEFAAIDIKATVLELEGK